MKVTMDEDDGLRVLLDHRSHALDVHLSRYVPLLRWNRVQRPIDIHKECISSAHGLSGTVVIHHAQKVRLLLALFNFPSSSQLPALIQMNRKDYRNDGAKR